MPENDNKPKAYKRKFGDRIDGRRVRTLDAYHTAMSYIMPKKYDSCNYFTDSVEVTDIDRFLRKLRTERGMPGVGMLHLITAAFVRTTAEFPELNRFISGQRVFQRYYPELVMSVKLELKTKSPETSMKVPLERTDTLPEVYAKITEQLEKARGAATKTDNLAGVLNKLPRPLFRFAVWLLDTLDYYGKLPRSIIDASPFHGGIIITDLGSIGIPNLYHHLYSFGNLPLFFTIGSKRRAYELDRNGGAVERKYVEISLVSDERITDGFYFSQAYRYFNSILRNPERLMSPPEHVNEDIR
ncbi:MAG: 2-oxo acid dehydrogenase subunit E2 [Oscillospiraceae bacterium]|nr:2-oxo acid dehydrogenase subunit E2 [Oscillospiraceae bacterium]